jgi:hypothetical protein
MATVQPDGPIAAGEGRHSGQHHKCLFKGPFHIGKQIGSALFDDLAAAWPGAHKTSFPDQRSYEAPYLLVVLGSLTGLRNNRIRKSAMHRSVRR